MKEPLPNPERKAVQERAWRQLGESCYPVDLQEAESWYMAVIDHYVENDDRVPLIHPWTEQYTELVCLGVFWRP
jgi:hypothetical protein